MIPTGDLRADFDSLTDAAARCVEVLADAIAFNLRPHLTDNEAEAVAQLADVLDMQEAARVIREAASGYSATEKAEARKLLDPIKRLRDSL